MNLDIEKIKATLSKAGGIIANSNLANSSAIYFECLEALAALEAYDPDSTKRGRSTYDFALEIMARVSNPQWTTGTLADKIEEYIQARCANPDAIRRECAEAAVNFCSSWNINSEWLYSAIISAGKE